jgi:hypothetical protein
MSSVTHTFSHSCSTSTSCPYLYVTVWNNWTTGGRGGPASVSVAGTVYSNITTCPSGCTATSYTISSTSVTAGSSVAINVAGGTTRWKPGGSGLANGDKFTLAVVLTVTNGATTVGYVYDTFVITLS